MRWFILSVVALSVSVTVQAHHPGRECEPVHPRYDLIGPLGTRLPISHRRKYNRPSHIGGKIAYHIAPTSQEAMAWHDATHRGLYENDRPRIVVQYFYPKPWEALRVGPRPETSSDADNSASDRHHAQDELAEVPSNQPIANDTELIEQ